MTQIILHFYDYVTQQSENTNKLKLMLLLNINSFYILIPATFFKYYLCYLLQVLPLLLLRVSVRRKVFIMTSDKMIESGNNCSL